MHFTLHLLPCLSATQYARIRFIRLSLVLEALWKLMETYTFSTSSIQENSITFKMSQPSFHRQTCLCLCCPRHPPLYFVSHSQFSKLISCQIYSIKSFLTFGDHNNFSSHRAMEQCVVGTIICTRFEVRKLEFEIQMWFLIIV